MKKIFNIILLVLFTTVLGAVEQPDMIKVAELAKKTAPITTKIKEIEDDLVEFIKPNQELSNEELKLDNSMKNLLDIFSFCDLEAEENQPLPSIVNNANDGLATYLVFGYPVDEKQDLNLPNQKFLID